MSFVKIVLFAAAIQSGGELERLELPGVQPPPARECGTATEYGYGTRWHGNITASGEQLEPREEATCAHRTLPLGTVIYVETDSEGGWCRVNDRGPYMALVGGDRVFRPPGELREGERWDGIVDLSIRAADRVGMDGKERGCLRYYRPE